MTKLKPWNYFRTFYSANQTQNYLNEKYANIPDGEKLAFQNCYTLIYYLEHGKKYYDQSLIAPYELQPVLLFYGMIQLMKAAILTVDPNYPETTQVLAHGVTTRKRKKIQYEFMLDEVKIQKNGLITHFSEKIFNIKQLEGEKFKMGELMKRIPEIHTHFYYLFNKKKISVPLTVEGNMLYSISSSILDEFNLTASSFIDYLQEQSSLAIENGYEDKKKVYIKFKEKINNSRCSPLLYDLYNNQFTLPTNRALISFLPELLVHYLILYNLSMVCRYDTDWWGDLFHHFPSNDLPFITEFLEISKYKVPYYLALIFQSK